jgi:hypothetical protein
LLAHQAGLVSIDCRLTPAVIADHDQMAVILARQPAAPPATSTATTPSRSVGIKTS